MAADSARKIATYQDVLDAPEHLIAEIIDGELVTSPRPSAPHAQAASVLGMELGSPFHRGRGGPGGWIILDEPELHLGPDVLVPDLAGWRRERMPSVPDVAYFELAPDWACEVLSPSTALRDRRSKLPIFARENVRHVWLLDPRVRSLEVLSLTGSDCLLEVTHGDQDTVRVPPFDAIELELASLWPEPAESQG